MTDDGLEPVLTRLAPRAGRLHLARAAPDRRRLVEFVDHFPGRGAGARRRVSVSTQAGCAVGCAFCDAGALGFLGNLAPEQIAGQVLRALAAGTADGGPARGLDVELCRMGEPSLNPAVPEALRLLRERIAGPDLGVLVSTVAPRAPLARRVLEELAGLRRLFAPGRLRLQFSLHATDEAARREIVPVKTWDFEEMARFGREWVAPGDAKVVLNLAPSPDAALDFRPLARRFDPRLFSVRLTPVAPSAAAASRGRVHLWRRAPRAVSSFARALRALGFETSIEPGEPALARAGAADGQLWSEELQEQAQLWQANLAKDRANPLRPETLESRAAAWRAAVESSAPAAAAAGAARHQDGVGAHAALLVVDMQELFLSPRSPAYLPAGRAVAGRVAGLLRGFREAGRPVAFARHGDAGPLGGPFAPAEGEPVWRKRGASAFTQSAAAAWLRERGATTVVLCGLTSDLCVLPTARDALALGFAPWLALDACASTDETRHTEALRAAAAAGVAIAPASEILENLCLKSC